eukprot:927430-Amphidinium_carterae.1
MDDNTIANIISASPIPSRAKFVGKFYAWTGMTSVCFGLVSGQVGVLLGQGPVVAFMAGSWLGFSLSCVTFWKQERERAEDYLRKYPELMEHTIRTEFGTFAGLADKISFHSWLKGPYPVLTWSVLAAQSCSSTVQEIQEEKRVQLLEKYKQELQAESADQDDS